MLLLPLDPEKSAADLREGLMRRFGVDVAVVISDSLAYHGGLEQLGWQLEQLACQAFGIAEGKQIYLDANCRLHNRQLEMKLQPLPLYCRGKLLNDVPLFTSEGLISENLIQRITGLHPI